jgi:hypothetical protein
MTDGHCEANISEVRSIAGDEVQWLGKFEDTCSLEAGHGGQHVFNSTDDEHLRYDAEAKQFGSYRDAPPEGEPALIRFEPVEEAATS